VTPGPPLVLCLSGHDPSGGAGIHADLEAVAAQGAHALTVITAHTVQDSGNVYRVAPVAPAFLREQIDRLLADCHIAAIKLGLLGDVGQLPVIVDTIRRAGVPVICDPVLRAGGGADLAGDGVLAGLRDMLLPYVDLLTPNGAEARRLAPHSTSIEHAADALAMAGCRQVLVTGGDEPGETVCNLWRRADGRRQAFRWPRLPGSFHGAGCTLAAAIAGRIARGEDWATAIDTAQRYTHRALAQAYVIGQGRRIPRRHAL
jgi:hydroxymethylpyrimidine/phosphomethylpyrimidine kinase